MSWTSLLDFNQISSGMISGLNDFEIEELASVQEILRNDPTILDEEFEISSPSAVHVLQESSETLPPHIEEQLRMIQSSAIPPSTAYQQRKWTNEFISFLEKNNRRTDFQNMCKRDIATSLSYFYSQLKTKKNQYYAPASLNCIRAALYRYFMSPSLSSLNINIIEDKEFHDCNLTLKGMAKKFYDNGGTIKCYNAIEKSDMDILRTYFNRSTPERLQEEVYFIIEYYLGTRGREWIKFLKRDEIFLQADSKGREYFHFPNLQSIQKNDQPTISNNKNDKQQERIYAYSNPETCPVQAIKTLLNKLPENSSSLFYYKRKNWKETGFWYNPNLPIGINTVGSMMKTISKSAELSKIYTGHCVRSTVITSMFNIGASVADIKCVSGHKSDNSVDRYVKRIDDDKKSELSSLLSRAWNKSDSNPTCHFSRESNSKF